MGLMKFDYKVPPRFEQVNQQVLLELHRHAGSSKKGANLDGRGHRSTQVSQRSLGWIENEGHNYNAIAKFKSTGQHEPQMDHMYPALLSFEVTPSSICWKGSRKIAHSFGRLSKERGEKSMLLGVKMIERFRCIFRHDMSSCQHQIEERWQYVRRRFLHSLWVCGTKSDCEAVVVYALNYSLNSKTNLVAFEIMGDAGPYPLKDCPHPKSKQVSFQKVAQLRFSAPGENVLDIRHSSEAMIYRNVQAEWLRVCRCSASLSPTGCTLYYDNEKPLFWCYVDNVEACKQQGYTVHYQHPHYWTEDICPHTPKLRCNCSGLGFKPPLQSWNREPNHSLLEGVNGVWRYGSSCERWDEDHAEWCFVGFDSVCPDRKRISWKRSSDVEPIHVYISYAACSQHEAEENIVKVGSGRCLLISRIAIITLILLFLFGLLMQDVVFEFLKNGCGDQFDDFVANVQYEAESSDEDEFEVKEP